MPTSADTDAGSGLTPTDLQNMEKYGITRIPTEYYVYRSYRYANLADALTQAKLESTIAD